MAISFFGITLDWETESSALARYNAVIGQLTSLTQAVTVLAGNQATQTQALGKIMTDIENLTAAVTALQTAVTGAISAIETELAKIAAANTGNDPAIAAAVESIKTLTANLTTESAKVTP